MMPMTRPLTAWISRYSATKPASASWSGRRLHVGIGNRREFPRPHDRRVRLRLLHFRVLQDGQRRVQVLVIVPGRILAGRKVVWAADAHVLGVLQRVDDRLRLGAVGGLD